MLEFNFLSVPGPKQSKKYFGFKVSGGRSFSELSILQTSRLLPHANVKFCLALLSEWGIEAWPQNLRGVTICAHSLNNVSDVAGSPVDHPSFQHGYLLDFLIKQHPEAKDEPFFIIDPDFYLLSSRRLIELRHKLSAGFSTIGVTYHVSRYRYYMDFPVVYFQGFSSRDHLDFLPEVSGSKLGNSHIVLSSLLSSISRIHFRLIGLFEHPIFATSRVMAIAAQFLRLIAESRNSGPEEVQDTGFKNRARFRKTDILLLDIVQEAKKISFKTIDRVGLLVKNPELALIPNHLLDWYVLRHGTIEKRNFSGQPIWLRLLGAIPLRGRRSGPPIGFTDINELQHLNESQIRLVKKMMRMGADFYCLDKELVGFHLGSRAKSKFFAPSKDRDLEFLQKTLIDLSIN